jgi:glycosyltransferase involved in cell wall biosynthesis
MMAASSARRAVRLGYLVSHPVQYQAPLLRRLAQQTEVDFKVYFLSGMSTGQYFDTGFGRPIEWDVPLLDGYKHEFLSPSGENVEPSRLRNLAVEKVLARDRVEVLWQHGWGYFTNLRALWHARRLGIKTLMRGESNLLPRGTNRLKQNAKDAFLRWCFSRVDAFLCIGRLNREFYRHYGVADTRLFDVPYAVDNEFFHQRLAAARENRDSFRTSLGLDARRPVILFAGKLVAHKAPGDLLEAYKRLSHDGASEPEAYLVYVGDGVERQALEELARQTGWNSIRFIGFRNQTELPAFFDLCDVFVMPSRWEPWGLVVNEVMNAAKPIVISDGVGCAPDLVRNGVNGMVFPAGNVAALADSLRKIISSDELRKQMGRNSGEMISHWSFREDLAGILNAVERVMS